jgi:hypothetical protein
MSKPLMSTHALIYFAFRTGEEMTAKDLDVKLGLPRRSVPTLLQRSCRNGLLSKGRNAQGSVVYRAGPRLLAMIKGMERWL